jgi:hypothetical protein
VLLKWLLILVLIGCGFCLAVSAQQPPVKPVTGDTLKPAPPDSLQPVVLKFNFIDPGSDTPGPDSVTPIPDTLHPDSLTLARDSLRRPDSIRQANYIPNATALQRQIDSANAASTLSQNNPVDSLKLRMDALMAAAANTGQQRPNGPPGSMAGLMHQNTSPAYSPPTGTAVHRGRLQIYLAAGTPQLPSPTTTGRPSPSMKVISCSTR